MAIPAINSQCIELNCEFDTSAPSPTPIPTPPSSSQRLGPGFSQSHVGYRVGTMAGSGKKGLVDGPAREAQLNTPEGICLVPPPVRCHPNAAFL